MSNGKRLITVFRYFICIRRVLCETYDYWAMLQFVFTIFYGIDLCINDYKVPKAPIVGADINDCYLEAAIKIHTANVYKVH